MKAKNLILLLICIMIGSTGCHTYLKLKKPDQKVQKHKIAKPEKKPSHSLAPTKENQGPKADEKKDEDWFIF